VHFICRSLGLSVLWFFVFTLCPFPLAATNPILHSHCAAILCHCIIRSTVSYFAYLVLWRATPWNFVLSALVSATQLNKRRINRHCERDDTTSYLPLGLKQNTREIARKVQEHKHLLHTESEKSTKESIGINGARIRINR